LAGDSDDFRDWPWLEILRPELTPAVDCGSRQAKPLEFVVAHSFERRSIWQLWFSSQM